MAGADLDTGLVWFIILAAGAGTFLLRLSFIQLMAEIEEIPPAVDNALRYIPVAVIAALVLPRLLYLDGTFALSVDNHRLLAGALAAVVAWRTESMLATLAVGMGALYVLSGLV